MIWVGLTGWGDHDSLYEGSRSTSNKLSTYASYFPVVEVDSSFYAIPPRRNIEKWVAETPETFQFIVKAYQGITGHQRGGIPFTSRKEMFEAFKEFLGPMVQANKLAMVLCQFPPWFDCQKKHVEYVRLCREQFQDMDVALEFRNRSWFSEDYYDNTLTYMKQDQWIHSICDEPQAGERSIPFVPVVTHPEKTLYRMHGRNVYGWNKPANGEEWRDVRYLYDYSDGELEELGREVTKLSGQTKESFVLFNNNSGGHAAANGKRFVEILGIKYRGLAPRQLGLFD
ncbi:uncharacterized protein YecE (DUF72 family) [Evansella vedderi]|uniref:Uncharacterized protein YecE (DUF72 family) n=1 Tax=Evansella vedderi TaxID=38282 RepID=A0ABU0A5K1_9BACI|nr:DUF72 domain-containing protein [Evansella vedderi]MDQ0257620.1 uncharacterized protein YecE (DUF72 family) [Evansella vedderi]